MKRKEGEREQVSRETERESVCERWSVTERGGSVSCKMGHWRNVMGEKNRIVRIGLHERITQILDTILMI
jgi:hypothetical protein